MHMSPELNTASSNGCLINVRKMNARKLYSVHVHMYTTICAPGLVHETTSGPAQIARIL